MIFSASRTSAAAVALITLAFTAATATTTSTMSLIISSGDILSGTSLTSCDPSPSSYYCTYGMAVLALGARQYAAATNNSVFLIPRMDTLSEVTRMHPAEAGVNLLMYERIVDAYINNNTNVNLINYIVDATTISSGSSVFSGLLQGATVKALSTSLDPPSYSAWRFMADAARVIDLSTMKTVDVSTVLGASTPTAASTPKCAILFNDKGDQPWSPSSLVSPLNFGTRLNATYYKANPLDVRDVANSFSAARVLATTIATLRVQVGFVSLINDDETIPSTDLLADMLALEIETEYDETKNGRAGTYLNYLPDVIIEAKYIRTQLKNITATYVSNDGTIITKIRTVLYTSLYRSSQALPFKFNLTAVQMSASAPAGTYISTDMVDMTRTDYISTYRAYSPDSLYYDDQAFLLNVSRLAIQNDPVVGYSPDPLPTAGPYTCTAGECGQGVLVTRALQWSLDTDVGMTDATSTRNNGWDAGNISFSTAFAIYPYSDLPCKAIVLGSRLGLMVEQSIARMSFNESVASTYGVLQMYNIKVDYVIEEEVGRVASISIKNKHNNTYEPLDRLKFYSIATTNYECQNHVVMSNLLRNSLLLPGESVDAVYSQQPLQLYLTTFLENNNPYTPILLGNLNPAPATHGELLNFSHYGLETCTDNQRYDEDVITCFDCPEGFKRSNISESLCEYIPVHVEEDHTNTILAAALGSVALIVLIVVVVVLLEYWRRSGSRSNYNAPKGPNVAIVFTDIKSSTKLWGIAPASMGVALDTHHNVIRQAIAQHRGYEVKTVGDSFMIAVEDPQRAVDLAVAIQHDLHMTFWPSAIDDAYDGNFENYAIPDDPDDLSGPEEGVSWNGIRVRVGVHYGPAEVVLDEVTKGFDYYGPTVNVAARVEGVAEGGQVCIASSVFAAINPTGTNYTTKFLAQTALRGVRDEVGLYEVTVNGLDRAFTNPLIFSTLGLSAVEQSSEKDGTHSSSACTTNNTATLLPNLVDAPLNNTTRAVRDAIQEACRAVRGHDRVGVIETLRKAWRVELPSGKVFTGAQEKDAARRRKRSYSGSATSKINDDTDEDIIFRVVAQRVAPALQRTQDSRSGGGSVHQGTSLVSSDIRVGSINTTHLGASIGATSNQGVVCLPSSLSSNHWSNKSENHRSDQSQRLSIVQDENQRNGSTSSAISRLWELNASNVSN